MAMFLIFTLTACAYFFFSTYLKIQKEEYNSFFDYLSLSIYFSGCICAIIAIIFNHLKLT